MTAYLPNSDALLRSTLRDTIRRLRRIRAKAGKDEENDIIEETGDSFQNLANAFVRVVGRVKVSINERNEGVREHGQDRMAIEESNEIRKDIRHLDILLQEMLVLVNDADLHVAREARKKRPKQKKLQLLNKLADERKAQYNDCVSTVELVREMDAERVQVGRKEIDVSKELLLGRRAKLREQLASMRRYRDPANDNMNDINAFEMEDKTVGGGRLEENATTAEQMKVIAQQDAKTDAGLDRIREGMGRLRTLAVDIGAQITMQNEMLDSTEAVMDKQTTQLRSLNRRITKYMKETKPMNCFFNLCCIFLIIAIIGFFLFQFNAI